MGKLIVIEGTDSSGKETQTKKLFERLLAEKYNVKKYHFQTMTALHVNQ